MSQDVNVQPTGNEIKTAAGSVGANVIRSTENWQFLAFIFAALTAFWMSVTDNVIVVLAAKESPVALYSIIAKSIGTALLWYLVLVNVRMRNALTRYMSRFKSDH